MPISGKELSKLFIKKGYKIVRRQGKGSHIKLRKEGRQPIIIPNHKELAWGLEKALRKRLKLESR